MKICHITTVHSAFDGRIFYRECVALANKGIDVSIVGPASENVIAHGVKVFAIGKPNSTLIRMIASPWKAIIVALKTKSDIYHFHDPEIIPAGIVLRCLGKKVVFDVHEYYSEIISLKFSNSVVKKIMKEIAHLLLEKMPNKFFNRLAFPTISFSREYGNLIKNVPVVNLPTINSFKPLKDKDFIKEYDLLHLGTITQVRMTFMLDLAMKLYKTKKKTWLFLGVRKNIIEWVRDNYPSTIFDYVTFIERVPFSEVEGYVRKCKIGFNYHMYEKRFLISIPMKVFEYMHFGLATITTALPEMKRYLTNRENALLIEGENPDDYERAIVEILEDEELRIKLIINGKKLIKEEVNFEKEQGDNMIKMYQEIIS